jgi:hypothetical protein
LRDGACRVLAIVEGWLTSRSRRRGAREATEVQEQPTARLAPEWQRCWADVVVCRDGECQFSSRSGSRC